MLNRIFAKTGSKSSVIPLMESFIRTNGEITKDGGHPYIHFELSVCPYGALRKSLHISFFGSPYDL